MTLRQAQGERIIFNARRLSDDITSVWTTKMRRRRAGSEAQDEAKPDAVKPFGRGQATRVQGVERPIVIPEQAIGRASCRARVCQYVSISVVAVSLKKKT